MSSLTWTGEWVDARSRSDLLSGAPAGCVCAQAVDFNHSAGLLLAAGSHPPGKREASGSCLNSTPGSAEGGTPCAWPAGIQSLCSVGAGEGGAWASSHTLVRAARVHVRDRVRLPHSPSLPLEAFRWGCWGAGQGFAGLWSPVFGMPRKGLVWMRAHSLPGVLGTLSHLALRSPHPLPLGSESPFPSPDPYFHSPQKPYTHSGSGQFHRHG